jgi:hypothetical protein
MVLFLELFPKNELVKNMKVIDPGHMYELTNLDGNNTTKLTFVKREGNKYLGNVGHYEGTNLQEVMRALIDRTKYLENQIHDQRNLAVITKLRECIWLLEDRAAERHGRQFDYWPDNIELEPTCNKCGHIGCNETCG